MDMSLYPTSVQPASSSSISASQYSTAQLSVDNTGVTAGIAIAVILVVSLVIIIAVFLFRKWRQGRRLRHPPAWLVDDREVQRRRTGMTAFTNGFTQPTGRRLVRMETRATLGLGSVCSFDRNMLFAPIANYRGTVVTVKMIHTKTFRLTSGVISDLNVLKDLNHDNINQFVGAHFEAGTSYVLFKYCAKGSLQDVLENEDITLDWMFKMSFALDLARGVDYLHKSPLKSHGNLKSSNCVIDSRWLLKVTDFGVVTTHPEEPEEEAIIGQQASALLWTAPELLRVVEPLGKGTQAGDVFSFAIILQEILIRVGPYGYDSISPEEIIRRVRQGEHPAYRPHIPAHHLTVAEKSLAHLMTSCWDEEPDSRPDFRLIRKKLLELNGGKKVNVLDNMLALLEAHNTRLEHLVADRTAELAQEKAKTDRLLYQMLPQSVAEQLKCGRPVIPEFYEAVSIFFSDIVGFTAIAKKSKPLEVVDLLNDLYTEFDDIISKRDVYKVETIGDAYMCVSGCPHRNGRRHSSEIAEMALDLVSCVTKFRIRHLPHEALQLRVGLHTGSCAAGVVGVAMPRYCLFGDTVNMASRMESTSKALHIHISSEMNVALQELECGFLTLERGMIQVKNRGIYKTYWLVGKEGYTKPLPEVFTRLRMIYDDVGSRAPSPSNASLVVGDGMYSALRKSSIAVSTMSVTSDQSLDDASLGIIPVFGSESTTDSGIFQQRKQRFSNETFTSLQPSLEPDDDDDDEILYLNDKHMKVIPDDEDLTKRKIPRIEIS